MPLPRLFHYTRAQSACSALTAGLVAQVTAGDPLDTAGVWLSPNQFGDGSPGSYFGALGLEVDTGSFAGHQPVYLGFHPSYADRHRFFLLGQGASLPAAAVRAPLPAGTTLTSLSLANSPVELLLPATVAAKDLCGIRFDNERGQKLAYNELEHMLFLAHVLATNDSFLTRIPYPHSTQWRTDSGWFVFAKLRTELVTSARGTVAAAPADVVSMLGSFGAKKAAKPSTWSAPSVHSEVTALYAAQFHAHSNLSLDLSRDQPFVPDT